MNSKKSNSVFQMPSFSLRFVCNFDIVQSNASRQPKLQQLMRKFSLLLVFSIISLLAISQTPTDTIPKGWRKGGIVSLNFGQGGSRNWAAGAEKWTVSLGLTANVFANRQMGKWSWDNSLDLGYGFLNTESDGYKKTDDKI